MYESSTCARRRSACSRTFDVDVADAYPDERPAVRSRSSEAGPGLRGGCRSGGRRRSLCGAAGPAAPGAARPAGRRRTPACPVITMYRPGKRPPSISSISWRIAFRLFSRTSLRTRWSVSTSSRTSTRPGVARVPQDDEQSLEEAQRAEVVDLALDAGGALDGSGHVRLRADPGEDPVGQRDVAGDQRRAIGAQRGRERRRAATDLRKPAFHELVDASLAARPRRARRPRRSRSRPPRA